MDWKNKKMWASIVAIALAIAGAVVGGDFKGMVCGGEQPAAVAPQQ